jgi:hypothetical protein
MQAWLTKTWYDAVLRMAQIRCDSKAALSELAPHSWFGVVDTSPAASKASYCRMREERDMVVEALRCIDELPLGSDASLLKRRRNMR